MTNSPKNGDIVMVDLGFVAKVRPCLVLCARPDSQRTISIIAPLTGEIRGGESEIAFPKPPLAFKSLRGESFRDWGRRATAN
jgi:mRNA-degrading endonuclease toxin of MazEF toxin-antitoxin module